MNSPYIFLTLKCSIIQFFNVQVEERRRREREKMAGLREALAGAGGATDKLDVEVSGERVGDRDLEIAIFCAKNNPGEKSRLRFLFGPGVSFN